MARVNNAPSAFSSSMDPSGVLFDEGPSLLRAIHPEFSGFFTSLLSNQVVKELIGKEIVDTAVSAKRKPGFSLVLEHRRIQPVNFCYEWPSAMLRDAALQTLTLCSRLAPEGLVLKDATPWNIVYEHAKPVFIDFASISTQEKDLMWVALDQYYRLFLFPLLLADRGLGKFVRAGFLASQQGITDEEIVRFLPRSLRLKYPWLTSRLYFPRMLISLLRSSGQDKDIKKYLRNVSIAPKQRLDFFESLTQDTASINLGQQDSRWSRYYENMGQFFNPGAFNQKQKVIAGLLDDLKPRTLVDIGCNMGGYAILAAQAGADVVAFDTDEDSINKLYRLVKEKDLPILPLVLDAVNPSPAAGYRGQQYPPAVQRFRSEGAFGLALTHHLAISQNQPFSRIAGELSDYCDKWLVTEFVPMSDPRVQELLATSRRDMGWYSLEAFIAAFKQEFRKVETFPSHPEGRVLCLCSK